MILFTLDAIIVVHSLYDVSIYSEPRGNIKSLQKNMKGA